MNADKSIVLDKEEDSLESNNEKQDEEEDEFKEKDRRASNTQTVEHVIESNFAGKEKIETIKAGLVDNINFQLDRRKSNTLEQPFDDLTRVKAADEANSKSSSAHLKNISCEEKDVYSKSMEKDYCQIKGNVNTAVVRNHSGDNEAETHDRESHKLNSYNEDLSLDRSLEDQRTYLTKCRCMPKRYVLAILSFFGFFNVYCLRVDLSVALVAMTNNHTRVRTDGSEYWVPAEFHWTSQIQGHILSAFYYGYLLTQIPGGYIAARFGGKNLFGLAILLSAILTLMTPAASRKHWSLLFALRFVEGLCEGSIYPAMYAIWSRWAPPAERAKLVTIPHSGSYSGSVAGTLIAGYLCELCGWAWVFYLFGVFALIWVVAWQIMVFDTPEEDKHISRREKNMILESLQNEQTKHFVKEPLPWCDIITSMPFLAILVAHTCEGWGFGLLQTSLPKFLSEALDFRISRSGEYTAFMYLLMGICVFVAGQLSDYLRQEGWLSATNVRKLFTILGFSIIGTMFLISIRLTNAVLAVIILIVGAGLESIAWCGFGINHLDIAPRYASFLFGITNTFATVPGIVSPLMVGTITSTGERSGWDAIFLISAVLFIFGAVFYGLFASAERQPWAGDPIEDDSYDRLVEELSQQRTSSPDPNKTNHVRRNVTTGTKRNLLEAD